MKTSILGFMFSFFVAITLLSCNPKEFSSYQIDYSKAKSNLNVALTTSVCQLLQHYYAMKDALILADDSVAYNAAIKFSEKLATIIQQNALAYNNIDTILTEIQYVSNQFIQIKDNSCEKQRVQFMTLSEKLLQYLYYIQIQNVPIYVCNSFSAYNERGAIWLHNNKQIFNPYFGNKMLYEGDIVDSLY